MTKGAKQRSIEGARKSGHRHAIPIEYRIVDGCFLVTSHKASVDGRVQVQRNNKRFVSVARYVWEQVYGKISKGYVLHHTCGNGGGGKSVGFCININHLKLMKKKDHDGLLPLKADEKQGTRKLIRMELENDGTERELARAIAQVADKKIKELAEVS